MDPEDNNNPALFYQELFINRRNEFPLIAKMFCLEHPLLSNPPPINPLSITTDRLPHTEHSITQPSGNPLYDIWKAVMIRHGGEYGKKLLTTSHE
jgi:hypothetical protein